MGTGRPYKKRKEREKPERNILITQSNPGNVVPRNIDYFKPARFKGYFTLSEMAREVPCDPSWLRKLERAGRIPMAKRGQRGKLSIRLWSPEQHDEIIRIIDGHQVGRPKEK